MSTLLRAVVRDVDDPTRSGRVLVEVPHMCLLQWAFPVTDGGLFGPSVDDLVVVTPGKDTSILYLLGPWQPARTDVIVPAPGSDASFVDMEEAALRAEADAAAARHGIPAALLRAVVGVESSWRPDAYNAKAGFGQWRSVRRRPGHQIQGQGGRTFAEHGSFGAPDDWGAWGLGQVMLITALDNGFPFTASPAELKNPRTNLDIAAKVLRAYHDKAGGDVRWTAAMYNAGPGNVPSDDPATWPAGVQGYAARVEAGWRRELGS